MSRYVVTIISEDHETILAVELTDEEAAGVRHVAAVSEANLSRVWDNWLTIKPWKVGDEAPSQGTAARATSGVWRVFDGTNWVELPAGVQGSTSSESTNQPPTRSAR